MTNVCVNVCLSGKFMKFYLPTFLLIFKDFCSHIFEFQFLVLYFLSIVSFSYFMGAISSLFSLKILGVVFFFFLIYLFIFGCVGSSFLCKGFLQLWRAGATLHRGARASHHRGLSCCRAQAPDVQAQQLWLTGPAAPRHVGSSQTRARTRVPCIGRQTLNHCTTREALGVVLLKCFILFLTLFLFPLGSFSQFALVSFLCGRSIPQMSVHLY